ncbi:MAG: tetratricopeptide repeat protein [Rubripirellula sp.]
MNRIRLSLMWFCLAAGLVSTNGLVAADLNEVRLLFSAGKYDEAAAAAAQEVENGIWNERWPRLLIQCHLQTGKYADALAIYEEAAKRYPTSLTLRMLGLEAYRFTGKTNEALQANAQIMRLLETSPSRYASRDNLVAAGRYFAMRGEDGRQILKLFFDRVRDADPQFLEAYLATAELALEKGDYKVAADTLDQAGLLDAADPRIPALAAKAWANSDAAKASNLLNEALQRNPRFIPALLYRAESEIDAEQYDAAYKTIQEVLVVNLHQPQAWSLLAVLAHLEGRYEIEALMRAAALSTWDQNPEVDHLIGKKLSQKYRFAEGAQYQRQAIEVDSGFQAATFQLAQDLLRLGQDETGWILAEEVSREDPYNVVAHNLNTLNDRIKGFTRIESDGIEVRMEAREASIYGGEVMNLLREAKLVLCEKYDVKPNAKIVVEIFPEQKDFAVRTFGLPGGAGYLGVCFGRVITANSPASQGPSPANWQSVLWHEFCHVVTLEKTRNRMPRWLSEGISVYEERTRDPAWGESMTPKYREMMLGDDLTAVSDLSGAFLSPPSPTHLQFAYYESSLVVEYLIDNYGLDSLLKTLDDLADGLSINDALARNVGSVEKLDAQFAEYARKVANQFAPDASWDEPTPELASDAKAMSEWIASNPSNYFALTAKADREIASADYAAAKTTLEAMRDLGLATGKSGGLLEKLATVYRELDDVASEKETLVQITQLTSDSLSSLDRLIQIARDQGDYNSMQSFGQQFLAIQPLIETGHTAVVDASEELGAHDQAVQSLSALAMMEPVDPAAIDFRKAKSLAKLNRKLDAKLAVLKALDEAPRFRDAHRLLLELTTDLESDSETSK